MTASISLIQFGIREFLFGDLHALYNLTSHHDANELSLLCDTFLYGLPNGSAINRSAVKPALPKYPRASPAPATYISPTTPVALVVNSYLIRIL